MPTAIRRPNPRRLAGFRLRSAATAAGLMALLALAAVSEAGQPVALIDDGGEPVTVSKSRSDSLAKAKTTTAKPKATATKPAAATKATTTPGTTTASKVPTSTAKAPAPTTKIPPAARSSQAAGTQPTAKAQTKSPEPAASRPTTVARLTPSGAGPTSQGKAAANSAVVTKVPTSASGSPTKTKPAGATLTKAAAGAATVATLASGAAQPTPSNQARKTTQTPQASPSQGAVRPVAGQKGTARATTGSTVAKASTDKPARRGAKAAGSTLAVAVPLDDHVTYQYNALGRRDVFQSLMDGEFVGADVGGDAPPDVGGVKVVGIVWGTDDQFAMVEDARGESYVLRRGDKVMNGYVEGLKRDAMIVSMTVDGQTQSVTIPVTRKGEKSNAIR